MQAFALIALGGIVGANLRYAVSLWAASRFGVDFPYGTLLVNLLGCFAIGLFLGVVTARYPAETNARLLVATGFLGAETTFSTYAADTVSLFRVGARERALVYLGASVLFGVALTAAGLALADVVVGGAW